MEESMRKKMSVGEREDKIERTVGMVGLGHMLRMRCA